MSEMEEQTNPAPQFEELPDAPPKPRLKLSWPGKLGAVLVLFWVVIIFIGLSWMADDEVA